jgi:hypothetical protein
MDEVVLLDRSRLIVRLQRRQHLTPVFQAEPTQQARRIYAKKLVRDDLDWRR